MTAEPVKGGVIHNSDNFVVVAFSDSAAVFRSSRGEGCSPLEVPAFVLTGELNVLWNWSTSAKLVARTIEHSGRAPDDIVWTEKLLRLNKISRVSNTVTGQLFSREAFAQFAH